MTRHESRLAAVQGMYSWDLSGRKDASAAISFNWLDGVGEDELVFARHILGGSLENIARTNQRISTV